MQNFIDDGYTQAGFIAAREGMHDDLRFTYRPMLPEEVDKVQAVLEREDVAASHAAIRGVLLEKLKSWSDELPVTADSLRRLRPALWNRLYLIAAGRQPSDPDPKATPDERDEWLQDVMESGKVVLEGSAAKLAADKRVQTAYLGEVLQ